MSTPSDVHGLAGHFWNANVPAGQWTETCPDFLLGISDRNKGLLSMRDEDYQPLDWATVRRIVSADRIDGFLRKPSELRRYIRYAYDLKRKYGSVLAFVQQERLHWESIVPSGDRPFTNANDYRILYNDWPYGVEEAITHLVVWTKFFLEDDQTTGKVTPQARQQIEYFVVKTFCGPDGVRRDRLVWFRNWGSLKSIHALEHFHVMLYQAPADFINNLTHGDTPMSVAMQDLDELRN